jgi:hypothetical protein
LGRVLVANADLGAETGMTETPGPQPGVRTLIERKLDVKTVEVLGLAVFRTLFRDGVRIPLKMDGMMDMDLVVKDNNILLNMNRVSAAVPELSIWRITFAYHGKPVLEYGRGIKNDLKVHWPQACFLVLAIWKQKRQRSRAEARGAKANDRNLVTMSVDGPAPGTTGEVPI